MASNQEIVDQSSSNIDVMVVPESPDVAPNSPSLIGGLTNDQAAGTSTGDAGTSKKDEQPARKRIRIDLDEDSEEEGEEDEESKKDLEDLLNNYTKSKITALICNLHMHQIFTKIYNLIQISLLENEIVIEPLGRPKHRLRTILRGPVVDLEKIESKIRLDRQSLIAVVPHDFETRVITIP
ncbi:uncharacterized protein LOC116288974 isoform X2 [Actinia tenebrosa]|uniref:Uncharacterized protein LOC116288974 isoform X2 n=1 Tax=Actinia tenebrosa TaxID=6105 RepID=A0A6P8H8Y5_ACTTE|nr:uncharacterized protein LOC116288974 isoform X2 [Actinia tenebrosa]